MKLRKITRIMGAALAMLMVFALLPAAALAEGGKDISGLSLSLGENPVYNGSEQTVAVSLKDGETLLTEGTDYSVSGNKATDAGGYSLTISGMGDYTGSLSAEYKILTAKPGDVVINESCHMGGAGSIELDSHIFPGGKPGKLTAQDSDGILESAAVETGKTTLLSYEIKNQDSVPGKSASVSLKVSPLKENNFEPYSITVNFTVAELPEGPTVSFDPNGGSGSMADVSLSSTSYVLPDCGFTAPANMHFAGWDRGSAGDTITVEDDIVLIAQWEWDSRSATVSYDYNDGSGTVYSESKTGSMGADLIFTAIAAPENKCYNFLGWEYEGQLIAAGAAFTANADMTLTARWELKPLKTYTVSFDANGGKDAPKPQSGQSRCGEVAITLTEQVPANGELKFIGWSLSKTDGKPILQPGGVAIVNDAFPNITLYAVWLDPKANPQTGDEGGLGLWAGLMAASAVLGAGAVLSIAKKKNKG